ncbi:major facilitator superfamily domain-containing protein [Nemania sp. FL0031]|nr:major facilitator superfamily domain-containing protein [Nemania sp. FL0031]
MSGRNDGLRCVSESSPLLRTTNTTANANSSEDYITSTREEDSHAHNWRIILVLCGYTFAMMLADSLQPAALTKVFEDVICDSITPSPTPSSSSSPPSPTDRCRAPAVQKELALVRGFLQLVPIFSGVLCTVPYGLLAERVGRKPVLILNGAGTLAAFSWILAICYWRFLSIRWVLLAGVFLFVGGGDPVFSSTLHVMVTDATGQADRAQIFLYLHAADVVAGFLGPAISGALMESGHTWTVLLLAVAVFVMSIIDLAFLIPETIHFKKESSELVNTTSDLTSPSSSSRSLSPVRGFNVMHGLLSPLATVLRSNHQAILLLCLFAPQTTSRELFTLIGLQYSNAKFGLSYARGNALLSFFQGAQGFVVLVGLPLVTHLVANPRGWSPWKRDRLYTTVSIAMLTSGLMIIGIAPVLAVEALGLLFIALGSLFDGLADELVRRCCAPEPGQRCL